jgi:hypothetical protein
VKETIQKYVDAEHDKHKDDTTGYTVWRWTKKIAASVGVAMAASFVVFCSVATTTALVIVWPVGLAAGGVIFLYMLTGKKMYELWEESNTLLAQKNAVAVAIEQTRIHKDTQTLLTQAGFTHNLQDCAQGGPHNQDLTIFLSVHPKVMAAIALVGHGKKLDAAKIESEL